MSSQDRTSPPKDGLEAAWSWQESCTTHSESTQPLREGVVRRETDAHTMLRGGDVLLMVCVLCNACQ